MTAPILEQAPVFVGQLTDAPLPEVRSRHRLSALVYERMARLGAFEGLHVELIDGELIEMPPMGEPHAASVTNTTEELVVPFRGKMKVRNQTPLNAGAYGRPEPDVAVVSLDALLPNQPPSRAELVVEVSDSTLKYDQTDKSSLYASLGVPDYWIVNLQENVLEVRRAPIERASARFGFDYSMTQIIPRTGSVSPLVAPDVSLRVEDLLP